MTDLQSAYQDHLEARLRGPRRYHPLGKTRGSQLPQPPSHGEAVGVHCRTRSSQLPADDSHVKSRVFGEMNNPTEMKHEKRGVRRTSQGRTGSLSKENSFRGVNGGPASIIPNFQSLGLRKMSLQSKRSIVELPVPPAAAAGVSALAGSSLTLDGELMKFIMPSGPSGESVRSIIAKTGASIYSYTDITDDKKSRLFYIEGPVQSVITALQIVWAAVSRYKQLAEGEFSGHQVERRQNIYGVDFTYQPPPRSVVPYAAGLTISKEEGDTYAIASSAQLLPSKYGCI